VQAATNGVDRKARSKKGLKAKGGRCLAVPREAGLAVMDERGLAARCEAGRIPDVYQTARAVRFA